MPSATNARRLLRECFGGALLLSLEILVAADLLRTVAVGPTLEDVGVLGIIVLIRTSLSFSLEVEIEGVAPWRREHRSSIDWACDSPRHQACPGAVRIDLKSIEST